MTSAIDALARALYDAQQVSRPTWDQLGETTRGVWRDRARPAPCDMGVGCEEAGICYAAAHGEPDRCGRP